MSENDYPVMKEETLRACLNCVDYTDFDDVEQAMCAAQELLIRRDKRIEELEAVIEQHVQGKRENRLRAEKAEAENDRLREAYKRLKACMVEGSSVGRPMDYVPDKNWNWYLKAEAALRKEAE